MDTQIEWDQIGWGQIQVLGESMWVGAYSVFLYWVLQQVFYSNDWNLFLFVLGFFKHLLGYVSGIQNLYCRYGYACSRRKAPRGKTKESIEEKVINKIVESLLEGGAYVVMGNLVLWSITKNRMYSIFATGCLLHIVAEWTGVHAYFCERC